jgi:hypothetical protein
LLISAMCLFISAIIYDRRQKVYDFLEILNKIHACAWDSRYLLTLVTISGILS